MMFSEKGFVVRDDFENYNFKTENVSGFEIYHYMIFLDTEIIKMTIYNSIMESVGEETKTSLTFSLISC